MGIGNQHRVDRCFSAVAGDKGVDIVRAHVYSWTRVLYRHRDDRGFQCRSPVNGIDTCWTSMNIDTSEDVNIAHDRRNQSFVQIQYEVERCRKDKSFRSKTIDSSVRIRLIRGSRHPAMARRTLRCNAEERSLCASIQKCESMSQPRREERRINT